MSGAELTQQTDIHNLYSDHHGWLHRWLRKNIGCTETTADLAHDTFLRIMAARRLPAQLGDEPRAWLTTLANRLSIDHWRRQQLIHKTTERLATDSASQYGEHDPPEAPSAERHYSAQQELQNIQNQLQHGPQKPPVFLSTVACISLVANKSLPVGMYR